MAKVNNRLIDHVVRQYHDNGGLGDLPTERNIVAIAQGALDYIQILLERESGVLTKWTNGANQKLEGVEDGQE